jgi:hypothetical protein
VEFLQKHFELSDLALGWTVSSALVGCVLGAWLAGGVNARTDDHGAELVAWGIRSRHQPN